MISIEDFKKEWKKWRKDAVFIKYSEACLEQCNLSDEDRQFLSHVGLPRTCAPCLAFLNEERGAFSPVGDRNFLKKLLLLGINGAGDNIAIDRKSGNIFCIGHEEGEAALMNSSVGQMVECILVYLQFVEKIKSRYPGECVDINEAATDADMKYLRRSFEKIDCMSIAADTFWGEEIENFRD